jgi:hypothetical protein
MAVRTKVCGGQPTQFFNPQHHPPEKEYEMTKFDNAWGYSKLSCFEECKARFMYQFIKKLPTKGSAAMDRGSRIHEAIESWLNGWTPDLPIEAEGWREVLEALKAKELKAEAAWGFDKNWKLLPDWFGKTCWLRAKSDAHFIKDGHLTVIDWKTGKYRVPSTEQVELYAIAGGCVYPKTTQVTAQMVFIDSDEEYSRTYSRAELEALKAKYETRVAPMYTEEAWEPTPSSGCRYCDFSKTKSGPCKY